MAKAETKSPAKTETVAKAPMPVPGWGPHPLGALRDEMERLFDDFFAGFPVTPLRRWRLETDPWRRFQGMFEATFPVADVVEGERDYRVTAELPGMSEKDIEISLAGDTLTVKGEKKEEREERAENRTSPSGASARSSVRSSCPRTPIRRGSRPASRMACSRSRCRSDRRRRPSAGRSRSRPTEAGGMAVSRRRARCPRHSVPQALPARRR